MATKTTKKAAATRTAKKTTAKRTASCKSCKTGEEPHIYTFVVLSLCFMVTAIIATVIMVGTKLNNDALAKDLEEDRTKPGVTIIYVDSAEETPEQN